MTYQQEAQRTFQWRWLSSIALILLLAVSVQGQQREQAPKPEELKRALELLRNEHALKWDSEMSGVTTLVTVYIQENHGRHPESWQDLERHYGEHVWQSKKEWEDLKRTAVFVPNIEGDIPTPEGITYHAKMMMVFAAPYDQKREIKGNIGRWVLWLLPDGKVVSRWYAETDIQRFSAWPQVQKVLDTAKAEQDAQSKQPKAGNTQSPTSSTDNHPQAKQPNALKAATQSAAVPQPESKSWLVWLLVVIAATVGAVWLFLRKSSR